MPDLTNSPSSGPGPEGALDLERTLLIGLSLASQLSEIHRRRDVHGGVSPAVVDIDSTGRVTLLALTADTPRDERYDAPEVVAGGEPTVQSDISGVGATMAAVALGHTPRRTASHAIDIYGHGLDAGLCNIIDAATAPDPLDRYESAEEMISELRVVESRHGFIPTVTTTVGVATGLSPQRRSRARIGQPNAPTTGRVRSRHAVLAISSAAALLFAGTGIGAATGEQSPTGRTAATPGVSADVLPSTLSPVPAAISDAATSAPSPSTTLARQSGSLPGDQGEVTVAEAETLTTAQRETIPAAPPTTVTTTEAATLPSEVPTVIVPPTSSPVRVGLPPSTTAASSTTPSDTTPVTTTPVAPGAPTPSTSVDVPSTTTATTAPPPTTPPPTTRPVPTTQPAPTTQPVPTTQPAPTTTVAPAKPPRVGQINAWKNPDDSGTWAFGAPDAERCAVARWELSGPVSTSKTKDPRDSSGATNGCFNDVQRFNTYFENVALTHGDYTITLTVTHVKTGLSGSNSASFTVG